MDRAVRFGMYRFEPAAGRLWRGEHEIRLTPKASGLLAELIRRAGAPVSKEDLVRVRVGRDDRR